MNTETKYLESLQTSKELVDIYTDMYDDSYYGFIVQYNDDYLVLESIDDDNNPDGLIVFYRENITRIRWGGNEITTTQKLIDQSKRLKEITTLDLSSIQTILNGIQDVFGYVNISFEDIDSGVCFIGEIESMDDKSIVVHEYGTKISLDRKRILLRVEDITKVEGGGSYEERIKRIIKN